MFLLQLIVNIFFYPKMLYLFIPVIIYLLLMGKEFFVSAWLKKNIVLYIITHMMIIPLIDVYASGLDWWKEGAEIPKGLLIFLGVSYMNGVVIEFGRKITERTGRRRVRNLFSIIRSKQGNHYLDSGDVCNLCAERVCSFLC